MSSILTRDEMIRSFPKGGKVAEIGVFGGDFSQIILDGARPEHLYLIDSWAWGGAENDHSQAWENPPPPMSGEDKYRSVLARFSSRSDVTVIMSPSVKAADVFPDGYFDWIYIDAAHDRLSVLADLKAWEPKVKRGGILSGDDYLTSVVEALDIWTAQHPEIQLQRTDPAGAKVPNWWYVKR